MSVTSSAISPNPWVRILDALEKKVNRHSYDTWLKPTRYSHAANGVLFVRIPTAEFRHVGDKYADLIQEAIDNLGLGFNDVKFVTPEDDLPSAVEYVPDLARGEFTRSGPGVVVALQHLAEVPGAFQVVDAFPGYRRLQPVAAKLVEAVKKDLKW